jgi:hypothetical protein
MRKERRERKREEPITERGTKDIRCNTSFYDNDFSLGGDDDGIDVVG